MATGASTISRAPRPSSLADVLDLILDKGLVIDAYVRVSLAGIELLTVDARVVVASVDTYLRFAEAVSRLDLTQTEQAGLPGLFDGGRARRDQGEHGARPRDAQAVEDRSAKKKSSASAGDARDRDRPIGQGEGDQGVLGRIAERARR